MVAPRYLVDTNVLSEPIRKEPDEAVVRKLREFGSELATASVVWHELVFGVRLLRASRKRTAIERYLAEVVAAAIPILPYDGAAAEWHGEQRARLSKAGLTPPFVDGQIAAVAAVHDLILITDNVRDFAHFHGSRVERWHESVRLER
ncbi:MAG: type II toxin-antitoxin system VapC family toxin [Gemmatimonadota bacterium]